MKKLLFAALLLAACSGSDSNATPAPAEPPHTYRVMAGVSMGGYGAGYLGTQYHEKFDLVGVMGGPLDWTYLAWYIQTNLMGGFYDEPGLDYRYEGWFEGIDDNFERDEYIELMEDLALTWGNQISYNPKSTFYPTGIDPDDAAQMSALAALNGETACEAGLPTDSPLRLKGFYDDEYNDPAAPYCETRFTSRFPEQATDVAAAKATDGLWDAISYCDGGDRLGKTVGGDVKGDGVIQWGLEKPDYGVRTGLAIDCNGNGKRDLGEPVIRNFSEPYRDCGADGKCNTDEAGYNAKTNPDPAGDDYDWRTNPSGTEHNLRFDEGEPYEDLGLDGLAATKSSPYDYGEGNKKFDYNPHRKFLDAKDPTMLLKDVDFSTTRYYIDAGVKDTFFFNKGAERFVGELTRLGQEVNVFDGFDKLTTDQTLNGVPWDSLAPNVLVLYGDPNLSTDEAEKRNGDGGHVGTPTQVVQRMMYLFKWISMNLPHGDWEPTSDLAGFADTFTAPSKILGKDMTFGVGLPPGYCSHPERRYPVVYLLHGYGMDPEGFVNVSYIVNLEMATGRMQKMILVYPDGHVIKAANGSFFVNHIDDSGQDPYRYEDYYMQELLPYIDEQFRTKAGTTTPENPFFGCPARGEPIDIDF